MLISTLYKVIYYKGTFLQDSTKVLLVGWRPAEKCPFFNMHLLVLDFLWVKYTDIIMYIPLNLLIRYWSQSGLGKQIVECSFDEKHTSFHFEKHYAAKYTAPVL
jgi:hypothetical protein